MASIDFNEKEEMKIYKDAGAEKGYGNYCAWEDSILKKIKGFSLQENNNLRAYLKKLCESCEHENMVTTTLWIPLFALIISFTIAIPSIYIGMRQYQDNIQSELDNTYLENMAENGAGLPELIPKQVENFQNRVDQCNVSINFVNFCLVFVYIILISSGGYFTSILKKRLTKIAFYRDYINVLDKAISKFTEKK